MLARPRPEFVVVLLMLGAGLAACSDESVGTGTDFDTELEPAANEARDVRATELEVDVASRHAVARLSLAAADEPGASLEVRDLDIRSVTRADGSPLPYRQRDGWMDLVAAADEPLELVVDYGYELQGSFEGALSSGLTFVWPYFCGNLFPCKSAPADGLRFSLTLSAVPEGRTAVYPAELTADAPSYMPAWAVGAYTRTTLGTTPSGTTVSVYWLPGGEAAAMAGTTGLVEAFGWLEQTYGAYLYGSDVASVAAPWGPGAYGGMEHHPYWHVSTGSMADQETHVHEATHGWFGNGVRLACWEDLTLSEGTTTYVTARAIEATRGAAAAEVVWSSYESQLDDVIASEDRVAWPEGCGVVDVLTELWNGVVYQKGAFFLRAVEAAIGREAIDHALARFYAERKGTAAGVADLLATIKADSGFDAAELAQGWLRSLGRPDR